MEKYQYNWWQSHNPRCIGNRKYLKIIELSKIRVLWSLMSTVVATRHMWLLRIWNVGNRIEYLVLLHFNYLKFKRPHMANGWCQSRRMYRDYFNTFKTVFTTTNFLAKNELVFSRKQGFSFFPLKTKESP